MKKEPKIELRNGRRDIEDSEISILKDLYWDKEECKWILYINIKFESILEKIELTNTNWYILIDDNYPKGEIAIYPDDKYGIKRTYPHQSYNDKDLNKKWRNGKLCLDVQSNVLNRRVNIGEPRDEYERLNWYCQRLKNWILLASTDELLKEGDYFELPVFPTHSNMMVIYDENELTLMRWKYFYNSYGSVEFYNNKNMYIASKFIKKNNKLLYNINWGDIFTDSEKQFGIWILIDKIPLQEEWEVVENWGQLKKFLQLNNIDLREILLRYDKKLRDGKSHIIMLGFPISNKVGSEYVEIHWQGIKIPVLSFNDKEIKLKGFMNKNTKYIVNDFLKNIGENRKIEWINSENWNEKSFYSRGMLSKKLVESKIMIIGCGSLGSSIAEYLSRGGIKNITIVDNEKFSSGNLVRHTLSMDSLNKPKIHELKNRLILNNPKLKVNTFGGRFEKELLEREYDLIIDCTANNNILNKFENVKSNKNAVYFNISFSKGAKIVFLYSCILEYFLESTFESKLDNYREKYFHEDVTLPREGIGCWHPVFPAKMYEITLMASIVINYIENFINNEDLSEDFTAYETIYRDKELVGVEKVSDER